MSGSFDVRNISSYNPDEEAEKIWNTLSDGNVTEPIPGEKKGVRVILDDGATITYKKREETKDNIPTIEILKRDISDKTGLRSQKINFLSEEENDDEIRIIFTSKRNKEFLTFTDEMLRILGGIKGKELSSLCCVEDLKEQHEFPYVACGNLFLNIEGEYIELSRYLQNKDFYATSEEWGVFACKKCDNDKELRHYVEAAKERQKDYIINERIEDVRIIRDNIKFIQEGSELEIDEALVIKTTEKYYIFLRNTIWSEDILMFRKNKSYMDFMSKNYMKYIPTIEKEVTDWKMGYGIDSEVTIIRSEIKL